ncbi:hypothetical protein [Acinetobacter baumannii]|uniref:hypothetical protein n=1 Tax=Acinetobacter baumannii TaxID=470 RepID=UPI00230604D6|nr:hypothetical protein [Acinetobacter baumannii]
MKKLLSLLLIFIPLSGCMATSAQYAKWGSMANEVESCTRNGYMDGTTYAKGWDIIRDSQLFSRVDPNKMEAAYQEAAALYPVSQDHCQRLAGVIEVNHSKNNSNSTQYTPTTYKPTTTYCNSIGTQVICNSY